MKKRAPVQRQQEVLVEKTFSFALWAGEFPSEEAFQTHINSGAFEREQGFSIDPALLPFSSFVADANKEELVATYSFAPELRAKVLAKLSGSPNSLVLHDGFVYRSENAPRGKKAMRFVGNFAKKR